MSLRSRIPTVSLRTFAFAALLALSGCTTDEPDVSGTQTSRRAAENDASATASAQTAMKDDPARSAIGPTTQSPRSRNTAAEADDAQDAAIFAAIAAIAAADAAAEAADRAAGADDPETAAQQAAREREERAVHLIVRVQDRTSGAPVVGAVVRTHFAVSEPPRTDAGGRFEAWGPMPHPNEQISVHCSTRLRSTRGKQLGVSGLDVRDGRAEITFRVDASQCVEPPVRTQRMRMAGTYIGGFESSQFIPCKGMPAEAAYYAYPRGYWVWMPRAIAERVRRAAQTTPDGPTAGIVYVEWLAKSTGPGSYGHLGAALYELEVEVLERVSPVIPAGCDTLVIETPPPPPPPPALR
jgi:hypothetical protein